MSTAWHYSLRSFMTKTYFPKENRPSPRQMLLPSVFNHFSLFLVLQHDCSSIWAQTWALPRPQSCFATLPLPRSCSMYQDDPHVPRRRRSYRVGLPPWRRNVLPARDCKSQTPSAGLGKRGEKGLRAHLGLQSWMSKGPFQMRSAEDQAPKCRYLPSPAAPAH